MSKNLTRKIKCIGECINKNDITLHPIDIIPFESKDKSFCPAYHYTNFKKVINCDAILSLDQITLNMRAPNLNLDLDEFLSFYDIKDIDSLNNWIDENNTTQSYDLINRIINLWIKNNIDSLKNFNTALSNIIKKIINYHLKINKKEMEKELPEFVSYWVNKKDVNDFKFNLIHDFKNFLSKKYGRTKN